MMDEGHSRERASGLYPFMVILLHDTDVGSTCLTEPLATGSFSPNAFCAIIPCSTDYIMRLENKMIKLQVCDTSGQERYQSMLPMYIYLAGAIIFVYDITDRRSFRAH
jgi:GTPase SAR1 family protein